MLTMQLIKDQWYYHHYPLEEEKAAEHKAASRKPGHM